MSQWGFYFVCPLLPRFYVGEISSNGELCTPSLIARERKKTIGPVKDYPENSKKLQDLLAGLRLNINTDGPTELTSITMTEAVEHYKIHELADCGRDDKAYSTRNRKTLVLNRWVLAHWGKLELRAIKTVAVEQWLKSLVTSKFAGANFLRVAR